MESSDKCKPMLPLTTVSPTACRSAPCPNGHSFFDYGCVGRKRWNSYYYQIKNVMRLRPTSVLEIGLGNCVVSHYLQQRVPRYFSIDIDSASPASTIASILVMPFRNNSFDVVLAAEVLEHLPFESFSQCLTELYRVSSRFVVLSLPQSGVEFGLSITLPFLGTIGMGGKFSLHRKHDFNGLHYWEINWGGYPLRRIRGIIHESGFIIQEECILYDALYNRFFVLEKG